MTATNHALTGALIGLTVSNPVIALPAALLSHFVLDGIPHFAPRNKDAISGQRFKNFLALEAAVCFAIVMVLFITRPDAWLVAAITAFLATSPDFMWIPKYLKARRGDVPDTKQAWVLRFHSRIQWFERPIGAVVEVAWLLAGITLLSAIIRST